MFAEISAAYQSCKSLLEIAKAANTVSNQTELLTAVNTVQLQLSDALQAALSSQEKQSELLNKIHQLEEQLRSSKDWSHTISRYQLHKFRTGGLVYKLKDEYVAEEILHHICVMCANKQSRIMLQENDYYMTCHNCKTVVEHTTPPPINYGSF